MKNVGLNLYSIRTLIKTEEDFYNTCLKLKEMGYTKIQYSGAEYDPERIKRVSEKTGMPVVLTHMPMDRIINDTEKLMDEHETFGCKTIGLGAMPFDNFFDEKKFKETVDKLNIAAKKMAERGFKFSYHHHHYEFYKFGNEVAFDYIINNAPYINVTIDTYWLQYGGADILKILDRLKGRVTVVHLKDYKLFGNLEKWVMEPKFAPCGSGTLDFQAIVDKMREIGVEHFLVEQDDACELENTMDLIKESVDYLTNNIK